MQGYIRTPSNVVRRLAVLAVGALAVTGCDAAAERLTEEAVEAAGGGELDVDTDDGDTTVSFEDSEDDSSGSVTAGGDVPDEWPDDIPLPDDHTVISSTEMSEDDGRGFMLNLEVSDSAEELVDFYAEHVEELGWTVDQRTAMGDMHQLMAETEDGERALMVNATDEDEGTTLSLMAFEKAEG